jgi:hypothetical protein
MEKEFVPYQQSLDMKSIGFDEPCIAFYLEKVLTFHTHGIDPHFIFKKNSNLWYSSSAPTYSQAFRWFREKHKLYSPITDNGLGQYDFSIKHEWCGRVYDTYEEAELACLTKLIEIVKEKL